jgi:pimeloyl-ACP methyl ester carboxylesterase
MTVGTITLTTSDIDPGNLSVTIIPDMQNPFQISFLGQVQALVPGTDMTVTATLSPSVPDPSYQWYLSGSALSEQTSSSITVGGTLQEGNYRLDLVAESDNVLSSSGFSFTVSQYARVPVFFVHGYGMEPSSFNTMIAHLEQQVGYPPQLLRPIDLVPNSGANIPAAEDQIQPAIEQFLIDVNSYLEDNHPGVPSKSQVDLVSHSMGGLSSRWYAAKVKPERVRKWISLAGANHGSSVSAFEDEGTPAEEDMYPAFATSEAESYVQYQLNGTPEPDVDETPYGMGVDSAEVAVVAPDSTRSILYITIAATPDDIWIEPDSSVQVDGAGGVPITIPPAVPAIIVSEGNFQMTNSVGHDPMLSDPDTIELVSIVLELPQ